jgi:hypothetical protein
MGGDDYVPWLAFLGRARIRFRRNALGAEGPGSEEQEDDEVAHGRFHQG